MLILSSKIAVPTIHGTAHMTVCVAVEKRSQSAFESVSELAREYRRRAAGLYKHADFDNPEEAMQTYRTNSAKVAVALTVWDGMENPDVFRCLPWDTTRKTYRPLTPQEKRLGLAVL